MAGLNFRTLSLAATTLICGCVSSIAQNAPMDSDTKEEIARAVLTYAFKHPNNYLYGNMDDFDFYIDVFGQNPSKAFIRSLGIAKIEPWSMGAAAVADTRRNRIGSGHNVMWVHIGLADYHRPNMAEVNVDAGCGPLCGGQSVVTLQKIGTVWRATSFQTTTVE